MSLEAWYGPILWERAVPKNRRLRKIKEQFDFTKVNELCEKFYSSNLVGRPPVSPSKMFRALLVQVIEGLSDRELEEKINSDLAVKWFLEMKLEEKAPDHSSFEEFRKRLGEVGLKNLFDHYVSELIKRRYVTRRVTVVDSTHILANVSKEKQNTKTKDKDKKPTDPDAKWGYKNKETPFFGYKQHTAMDGESRIITDVEVTSGNKSDHNYLSIMDEEAQAVVADRIYDSHFNKHYVKEKGLRYKIFPKYSSFHKVENFYKKNKKPNRSSIWVS